MGPAALRGRPAGDLGGLRRPSSRSTPCPTRGCCPTRGRTRSRSSRGRGCRRSSCSTTCVRIAAECTKAEEDGPHVVTGPIAVRGAQPGDLLRIDVLELEPRVPYGVVSNRHGRGALPGEYPEGPDPVSVFAAVEERGDGARRRAAALRPTRTPSPGSRSPRSSGSWASRRPARVRPHSVPPGAYGGNIDVKLLVVGTSLLLPGAGRGRARVRRRPPLRAGRRRGGADRDGGVAAGDPPVLRDPADGGARGVRRRHRAARRHAGVPGADRAERGPRRGRAARGPRRHRAAACPVRHGPRERARLPLRRDGLRHLAGRRRGEGRAREDPDRGLRC